MSSLDNLQREKNRYENLLDVLSDVTSYLETTLDNLETVASIIERNYTVDGENADRKHVELSIREIRKIKKFIAGTVKSDASEKIREISKEIEELQRQIALQESLLQ